MYAYSYISKKIISVPPRVFVSLKNKSSENIRLKEAELLSKHMFLTENNEADIRQYIERTRNTDTLNVKIVVTTKCNFRCTYCYQSHTQFSSLSADEESKALHWIVDKTESGKYSSLNINYYGGEPLLAKEVIYRMSSALQQKLPHIQLQFSITTNGYLVTRDILSELCRHRIDTLSISIDGGQDYNDRRRKTVEGQGTYETVLKNITVIAKEYPTIRLLLSMVVNENDDTEIDKLCMDLVERGISSRIDTTNIVIEKRFKDCRLSISDQQKEQEKQANALVDYVRTLRKYGIKHNNIICNSDGICKATRNNHFVINVDGSLYGCAGLIEYPKLSLGSIDTLDTSYSRMHPEDDECLHCCFAPVCLGGCRIESNHVSGKPDEKNCKKHYLEHISKRFLPVLVEE